jgi:hypothetical protein
LSSLESSSVASSSYQAWQHLERRAHFQSGTEGSRPSAEYTLKSLASAESDALSITLIDDGQEESSGRKISKGKQSLIQSSNRSSKASETNKSTFLHRRRRTAPRYCARQYMCLSACHTQFIRALLQPCPLIQPCKSSLQTYIKGLHPKGVVQTRRCSAFSVGLHSASKVRSASIDIQTIALLFVEAC